MSEGASIEPTAASAPDAIRVEHLSKSFGVVTALEDVSLHLRPGEVLGLIGDNGAVDMQPCGGTHVRRTGEIGQVVVTRIERKGKLNRRIRVSFA